MRIVNRALKIPEQATHNGLERLSDSPSLVYFMHVDRFFRLLG